MKSAIVLLTACASLSFVFASPHSFHVARHHAIAARVAVPDPVVALPDLNRRQNRHCKHRPNNSTVPTPSVVNNNNPPVVSPVPPKQEQPPVNAAPIPSPSPTPTPTPTPPAAPPVQAPPAPPTTPTPTPATPAPAPNSNLPSFMTGVQTGEATFFDVGLGACGITSTNDQHVVAVSWRLFDNYPGYNKVNTNTNPICGKKIRATYEGKSVVVTVVDRCADDTCLVGNLDFSRSAFGQLASFDLGRLFGMTWEWVA